MKKLLCVTICILLIVCALTPCVALASSSAHISSVMSENHRYITASIAESFEEDAAVIGVRFYGYYFGNSDIPVTVELYSDDNWDFNFYFGDADYTEQPAADFDGCMLTAQQTATKHAVADLFAQIDQFVYLIDQLVNTQIATSDIYAYNKAAKGERVQVSEHTYNILQLAKEMYRDTDGAFNPAVYRLVDLWGFSSRIYSNGAFDTVNYPYDRPVSAQEFWQQGYPLPDQKYVTAFSDPAFTDFSDSAVTLTQQDGQYFVTKNVSPVVVDGVEYGQWLDLGGIAKGYVVDCIKQMLQEQQIARYYIDAGSSSSAYGKSFNGESFSVGLQNPFSIYTSLAYINISDNVMSTSGQYIRKYTVDGVEYAHIMDAATGFPAQTGLKAVFITIPDDGGMWASKGDCLTTALTVMGRSSLVDFVNGYLRQNGITVVAVYETLEGDREILTNADESFFTHSEALENFSWGLQQEEGEFVYNQTFQKSVNVYKTLVIVLACIVGAVLVGVVFYHILRGKKSLQNVQHARKDKPFKPADIVAYLAVVLVIIVLFASVFGGEKSTWNTLQVIDVQTGEQLFLYNAARREYVVNTANSQNWQISVEKTSDGLVVTFTRDFDGTQRFNKMEITGGTNPTVQMTDSLCGFHQDCVHNFGKIDVSGGVIVCSPNRIKVITE